MRATLYHVSLPLIFHFCSDLSTRSSCMLQSQLFQPVSGDWTTPRPIRLLLIDRTSACVWFVQKLSCMSFVTAFSAQHAALQCREQQVKVARSAIVGRDSAVGTGSTLEEGSQVLLCLTQGAFTAVSCSSSACWHCRDLCQLCIAYVKR